LIEYFIALCEVPFTNLRRNPNLFEGLRNIYKKISTEDALGSKKPKTNHDVKQWSTLSKMLLKSFRITI
jgi:hypothetical protein